MASARSQNLVEDEDIEIASLMELLAEEEEDLTQINEAAEFDRSSHDVLSADLLDSPVILPTHLRLEK